MNSPPFAPWSWSTPRGGRGTRYFLSQSLYDAFAQAGGNTRKRVLDRDTNKALLLQYIEAHRHEGSPLAELLQALPFLSRDKVRTLLRQLRTEGRIHNTGRTKLGRWFPGKSST